ncbi:MAG: succinyl-diaminopimelate desuccinylase [Planctomycetota bacterium]
MSEIEELIELTEAFLRIDSPIGEEAEIAGWLEERLRSSGHVEVIRAANSLCVQPREFRAGRSRLMLVGHLDTVPPGQANPLRREGDQLHGLGASDMKAACALMLTLLERNRQQESKHDLIGVFYSREEGPFAESEMPLIHAAAGNQFEAVDLAICMEPTDNRIELGCLGTSHFRIRFAGRRAHSARPWQGENAIHKSADFLLRLRDWGRRRSVFHGLEFSEVMSATMVEFGGARNVIPDRFELNLNFRFAPGRDQAGVCAEVEALVDGEAEWELLDFCPSGKVCADNPLLQDLVRAAGSPEVRAKQAWTDVGRLSAWGIDAINYGPGATSQAHQDGEWVSIASLASSQAIMSSWLFG